MIAFLPESKTSASKFESVSVTEPAAAVPRMAASPSRITLLGACAYAIHYV